ncbi:DUF2339 domain-containing protein [Pontibacter diazotrophicus]|uniref:DUF2339 domain-containing protein n=1 Tax=Pontibacter diazotrophicus TaxID=1400979 RepID=A0A3D8L6Y9_9BACT|nr:DUF2339 domain-containing protein [Pontibacter diazotrophicus]RDV13168.1 DUF2339 domain-containing protein [Pontibacter diazotrophicus]
MELALLLLLIVLVLWLSNLLSEKLKQSSIDIRQLSDEVQRLREQLEKQARTSTPVGPPAATVAPAPPQQQETKVPLAPPVPGPEPKPPVAPAPTPLREPAPQRIPVPAPEPQYIAAFTPTAEPVESKGIFSSFRDNLDWEKFIGENLINKLGIAILVLGIGFFVKYAIDQEWINEVGRVAIGILAGGALLGVAHRLRKDYQAFSSVLVGGGMAVLYFTVAIAFHEYQLFSQTVTFLLMVGITGFTIFMSIAYNRIELAVLALVGGFASPFMVSTGEGNYVVLFIFILILNLGILVLAYFKKWNLLHIIAYVFTIILYGGWLSTRVIGEPDPPYIGALVFATLFYLVFFGMNIINNIKESRRFTAPEIMMLLSNTFLYYSAGMYALANVAGGAYQGLFTAAIAVFNFVFAYLLYQRQSTDRNLVYLLIGVVLTFLSLTAPVQLEGNFITLFWALEAVLLLWLSQKSGIKLIRTASVVVLALMLFSLIIDWSIYSIPLQAPLNIVFNKVFITGIVAVMAMAATFWLLRREDDEEAPVLFSFLPVRLYRTLVAVVFALTFYVVLLLELHYQLDRFGLSFGTQSFIFGLYNYLYLLGLLLGSKRMHNARFRLAAGILATIGIITYLAVLHPITIETRNLYLLGQGETFGSFLLHYLPLVLVLAMLAVLVRQETGFRNKAGKAALWALSFVAVFIASAELEHIALLSLHEPNASIAPLLVQIRKIGFPILWGISSFVLMMIGMQHKLKTLRIISLSLFFLTLAKLFLFDIRGISEGGKIAAFICLGMLLLVVSFMYQKLKVLILEDDTNATPQEPSTDGYQA